MQSGTVAAGELLAVTRVQGKYTFETGVPEKRKRLFLEKNYYTVFRAEDLSTNPLMVQNPGYGN